MIIKAESPPDIEKVKKIRKAPYSKIANYKEYKSADIKNPELYAFFVSQHGSILTYNEFCFIITEYNKELAKRILDGEKFLFHPRLSKLYIREKKRNHQVDSNGNYLGAVNWEATYALNHVQENGKLKRVFYVNQPYWYQVYWEHANCTVHNKSVYNFNACKAFRQALTRKLKNNPLIHLSYRKNTKLRGSIQNNLDLSDNSQNQARL